MAKRSRKRQKKKSKGLSNTVLASSAVLGAALFAPGAKAATIVVNTLTDVASPLDGLCTLREAISNANANADLTSGDCAAGTLGLDTLSLTTQTGTITLLSPLPTIVDAVTISGPGAATLTINANATGRVFYFNDPLLTQSHTVSGLTLTGGLTGNGGGAIRSQGENLTISNSTITGNTANGSMTIGGGGVALSGNAQLTINSSTITSNVSSSAIYFAGRAGGGVWIQGTSPALPATLSVNSGTMINGNTATAGSGGGFFARNTNVSIANSQIESNNAGSSGGGFYIVGNSATFVTTSLTNTTVTGNTAQSSGGGGYLSYTDVTMNSVTADSNNANGGSGGAFYISGISSQDAVVSITGSTITNNDSASSGGGLYINYSSVSISGSTISNNATNGGGGGLYLQSVAAVTIDNSYIENNQANSGGGGGIHINGATNVTVTNSFIRNNDATSDGGGLYANGLTSLQITSTDISGNTSQTAGGGLYISQLDSLQIASSNISGNRANSGDGGGLYIEDVYTTFSIDSTTINNNYSSDQGGGIWVDNTNYTVTISITNCTVSGNTARSGGGIYLYSPDGPVFIDNTNVTGNTAIYDGGGIDLYDVGGTVTIQNGDVSGNVAMNGKGGGLFLFYENGANSDTFLTNLTVTNNQSGQEGAGIHFYSTQGNNLTIANCVVTGNQAGGNGGGIYIEDADPDYATGGGVVTITGTQVSGNTAVDGAGIYIENISQSGPFKGQVNIQNSQITGNNASSDGGGISLDFSYGTLAISDSTISTNQSTGFGGGVFLRDTRGTTSIARTTIASNSAGYGGGIHKSYVFSTVVGGAIQISDSTISTNNVTGFGGGLSINNAVLQIANTTISGNTATARGGGMDIDNLRAGSKMALSTVASNMASTTAGGIYVDGTTEIYGGSVPLLVENSIVADSTNGDLGGTGSIDVRFSLIENPGTTPVNNLGGNVFGVDPKLQPLANNGGPTQTHLPQGDSPVLNAGDPAFTGPPATDQRGGPRIVNGRVDMGAVEFNGGVVQLSSALFSIGEGAGTFGIGVTRTGGTDGPVFVDLALTNGTGTVGMDITPATSTATVAQGAGTGSASFTVVDDVMVEGDETINVALANPRGATIGAPNTAVLTIVDNDVAAPTDMVQFSGATFSVNENGGFATVTVTRTPAGSPNTVTVNYSTSDLTANAGSDYTASLGTVTFLPTETTKTIQIPITDDSVDEPDETFKVTLSSPTGATLGTPSQAQVTIVNDDAEISITDVTEQEGTGSVSQFLFTIRLSSPSSQPVSVTFTTNDGTATAGSDYIPNTQTLTFAPGETAKTISIAVLGDSDQEKDETFTVELSNPVGAKITRGTGTATILDDDGPRADLAITTRFDATDPVPRFGPLSWIASVINNGPSAATNVRVVIRRPVDNPADLNTATAYKILTPSTCTTTRGDEQVPTGTGTSTVTFDTIACDLGTLNPNQSTQVQILSLADPARLFNSDGTDLGQLDHTARVSSAVLDGNPSNDSSTWPDVDFTANPAPTALLIRDLKDPINAGDLDIFTVARSGQPLPEGVPIGDVELTPSDNLTIVTLPPGCVTVAGQVTQVLIRCAALTPFSDFVFQHNRPTATGDVASLRGELLVFDPASGKNETIGEGLELTTIGAGALTSDVSLSLTGPPSLGSGVPSELTLTIINKGPQTADNVTVDVSSSGATIVLTSGARFEAAANTCTTLPCAVGTLAPGETKTIKFSVTPDPGASTIRVTASVTTSAVDPNPSNNVVTFISQLACPALDSPQISVVGSVTSEQPYNVSWTAVANTDIYILEEATTRDFTTITETQRVTGTSVTFVKLVGEPRLFFYRVKAANECGDAAQGVSSIVQVLIEPKPQTIVEPTTSTPLGSTQSIMTMVMVVSPENRNVPFTAETDQPWLRVTPSTGILLPAPAGTILTLIIDPTGLPVGAQTATLIIRRTDLPSLTAGANQAAPPPPVSTVPVSVSLVTPVTTASKTSSTDALIIPVVAHAQGGGGEFRSDVRIFNSAFRRVAHRVLFTPSNVDGRQQSLVTNINIDAGQTVAMDDILRKWFGLGGTAATGASGLIEIRPMDAPSAGTTIATSRTYRVGAPGSGTRGEYIAAVPVSRFVGKGGRLNLQQLAQNSQFRTNLGLVEGTGAAASLQVRGLDNVGRLLFSLGIDMKPGEQKQLNSIFAQNNISVNDARIEVRPTGGTGRVTAYASVLDSMTNDALHVMGLNIADATANRLVVAGVAELQGAVSRWRTDMRLYNSSDDTAQAMLQFYRQASTDVAAQATVTIAPGEVKSLDNVLSTVLNQQNVLGALHVVSDDPIIVTARTFNQMAATGATQGQFVPAITPAEGTGVGERSLHMLNVEQSVNFRTNLGVAVLNGQSARVEITGIPPDSRAVARTELTLGPNEFRQISNILQQMGLGTVYNARISVRVIDGGGRITAYSSVIDNRTDDAIFVSAK